MATKITTIFENPASPDHFEAASRSLVTYARKIPDSLRMETSEVWPKEDDSPTPAYLVDLYLPDYDSASRAVTTPEAGDFFQRAFEMATGGARAVFADIEES